MIEPSRLLTLAEEMAARAGEDPAYSALAVLASHAALEALVNRLGGEVITSFNYRARFLPKWHDLCERTLGRQLDAPPDLEWLHALRDGSLASGAAGAAGPLFAGPCAGGGPGALGREPARWAVDAARRVVEEFHRAAGRECPEWLD